MASDGSTPRGRAREPENQRLVALQAERLLDAGAKLQEINMLDVLRLLRLRGPDRLGMAWSTCLKWENKYRADPAYAEQELWRFLRVHRPWAVGLANLTHVAGAYESWQLPMRLWAGVSPAHGDIVVAELHLLARAHVNGGRATAAFRAQALAVCIEGLLSDARGDLAEIFWGVRSYILDEELRLDRGEREIRYIDGRPCECVEADIEDGGPNPLAYRKITMALEALFESDIGAAQDLLVAAQPTIEEKAALTTNPAGLAALLERAFLTIETDSKPAVETAGKLVREYMKQLDHSRGMGGFAMHNHASSAWVTRDWDGFTLRANACARHLELEPPFIYLVPADAGSYEVIDVRHLLASLHPFVLEALTSGPDPDLGVVQALQSSDALNYAWLMTEPRKSRFMAVVERLLAAAPAHEAARGARTATRNLHDLAGDLELGKTIGHNDRRELIAAMDRVAHLIVSLP